jgi:hypothetical protein
VSFGGRGGFGGTGLAILRRSFLRYVAHGVLAVVTAVAAALGSTWRRRGTTIRQPRPASTSTVLSAARATLTRVDDDSEGEAQRIA